MEWKVVFLTFFTDPLKIFVEKYRDFQHLKQLFGPETEQLF